MKLRLLIVTLLVTSCFGQVVTNQISFVTNTPQGSPQGWPVGQTPGWRNGDKGYCYNLTTNNFGYVMFTGNITSGSSTITGISSPLGPTLTVGQTLVDYGGALQGGTTITGVNLGAHTVSISPPAGRSSTGDSFSTFPHGSVTFTLNTGMLPPGLHIESLNSNNNANGRQGVITDSQDPGNVGCLANINPYAGVTGVGLYSFSIKACDNITGICACSTSTPWLFTGQGGDCSGHTPMQINVISAAPAIPVPTPVQTFIDTTYNTSQCTMANTIVVGCPTSPKPGYAFQAALNTVQPGQCISLQHGCVYNNIDATQNCGGGSCTPNEGFQAPPLVNHSPYQWIYTIPDDYPAFNSAVPQGTRVAPGNASLMPQIVDGIGADALELGREANVFPYPTYPTCNDMGTCSNYWRFTGIEFTGVFAGTPAHPCPGRNANTGRKVNCASSVLLLPQHNKLGQPIGTNNITCDRCYIHGSSNYDVAIGFDMDIIAAALVDSYVVDIHLGTNIGVRGDGSGNGLGENQAAIPEYTPGPIKVVNNRLASTGESFFAGGSGAIYYGSPLTFYDNPYVVRDVDVENNESGPLPTWESCGDGGTVFPGNYYGNGTNTCPTIAWASTCTAPSSTCIPGNEWETKNAMEFKSAQRVLVKGNIIENSWPSGQQGSCLLIETAAGESGNQTIVQDIDVNSNIIRHCSQTIASAGQDYNCDFPQGQYPMCDTMPRAQRISFTNNLLLVNPNPSTASVITGIDFTGDNSEFVANHNTVLNEDGSLPHFGFYFGADGFNCSPSPTCNNFAHFHLTLENNYFGGDPNGGGGTFPYYNMGNFGWYEPNPSNGATPPFINPAGFTGNVFTVPVGNTCGLGGLPGGPYPDCRWGWNSNPNLPNNAAVFPSGTVLGPCSNGTGGPSYGNFQLVTPAWSGSTTDGQQAGVECAVLCATGVCGGTVTLSITTTTPPTGLMGVAYSYQELAAGGAPPYTWSIISGSLPPGLSIGPSTGLISGTPTTQGTSSFTVKVTDSGANTATSPQSITINQSPPVITGPASCGNGTVGTPFTCTITETGGTGPFTLVVVFGALPPGLSTSALVISGTPTTCTSSCPYNFSVKVRDTNGLMSTAKNYFGTIVAGSGSPLSITTTSLPIGIVGVAYSQTLTATGGNTPYTWALAPGSQPLPVGLMLAPSTGIISGTPTLSCTPPACGDTTFQVTDSSTPTPQVATKMLPLQVVGASPSITIKRSAISGGAVIK